jgi:hypothetical protein
VEWGCALLGGFGFSVFGFGFGLLAPGIKRQNHWGGATHRRTPHQTQSRRNMTSFAQRSVK